MSFLCLITKHREGIFLMQFEQLVKEYLLELKLGNYSKRTMETYEQHIDKFIDFYRKEICKEMDIYAINKIHYKLFISQLLDNSLRATYINAILKSNRAFYSYLIREQVLKTSPMDSIKLLKETKQALTTFNDDEVKAMLNVWNFNTYLNARNKCIIAVLADTGIRISELINIKDSDLTDQYIRVLGKGDKWRVVPILNELNYLLTKYKRLRDNHFNKIRNRNGKVRELDSELFLGKTGRSIKTITNIEVMITQTGLQANVRASVRCSPHQFRHYWTCKSLELGQDIFTISKLLGHTNLSTTQIYLQKLTNEQLISKAVKFSPLKHLK